VSGVGFTQTRLAQDGQRDLATKFFPTPSKPPMLIHPERRYLASEGPEESKSLFACHARPASLYSPDMKSQALSIAIILGFLWVGWREWRDRRARQAADSSPPRDPERAGLLPTPAPTALAERVILSIAQGFGVGRIRWAPGTFGSLVGLLWLAALLVSGRVWVCAVAVVVSCFFSVWICGRAERILDQIDPGSVILDEIVAVPVSFAGWVAMGWEQNGGLPGPEFCYSGRGWIMTLSLLAAFRFFDVLKPWPIRQSQRLAGGWGITIDDLLAAGYVNALWFVYLVWLG